MIASGPLVFGGNWYGTTSLRLPAGTVIAREHRAAMDGVRAAHCRRVQAGWRIGLCRKESPAPSSPAGRPTHLWADATTGRGTSADREHVMAGSGIEYNNVENDKDVAPWV